MMTDVTTRGLTVEELETEGVIALPERQVLSLVNANLAVPVNAAVALNALSDNSVAVASATQTAPIFQGIGSFVMPTGA